MYEAEVTQALAMINRFHTPPELAEPEAQARRLFVLTDSICEVLLEVLHDDMTIEHWQSLEDHQRNNLFGRLRDLADSATWTAGSLNYWPEQYTYPSPEPMKQLVADASRAQDVVARIAGSLDLEAPFDRAIDLTLSALVAFAAAGPLFARLQLSEARIKYYALIAPELDEIDRLLITLPN